MERVERIGIGKPARSNIVDASGEGLVNETPEADLNDSEFRFRIRGEDVRRFIGMNYYEAVNHGIPQAWVEERFPGVDRSDLLEIIRRSGALIGQFRDVYHGIGAIYFSSLDQYMIEWDQDVLFARHESQRPQNSLVERSQFVVDSVYRFREACVLVEQGDLESASQVLRSLDSEKLRQHYYSSWPEYDRLNSLAVRSLREYPRFRSTEERMPSKGTVKAIFERDSWSCRWCNSPVIDAQALKKVSSLFPDVLQRGPTNDLKHGLILAASVSLDHVRPHSFGGGNDYSNLVTSCWPCQFGRGNDLIERLGLGDPRLRDPIPIDWDGCSRVWMWG